MTTLRILSLSPVFHPEVLAQVWGLRYSVLREPLGMPYSTASFDGDELDTTEHLVAFSQDLLVGCVSVLIDAQKPSIQLRGMAVLADQQGSGIGAKLLAASYAIANDHQKGLWCNARHSAIPFYEKNGWTSYGPFFEIPIIGKHVAMQWKLPDHALALDFSETFSNP